MNAKTDWNHAVELHEKEPISVIWEREIRSTAATSTHVKQPISGTASTFVNRINPTARTMLYEAWMYSETDKNATSLNLLCKLLKHSR